MAEKCPKCKTRFHSRVDIVTAWVDDPPADQQVDIRIALCPECGQFFVYAAVPDWKLIYPPIREQVDLSKYVPENLHRDFVAAQEVHESSPEASAMLSRRCLQRVIREYFNISKGTLEQEINSIVADGMLPSHLAEDLHTVRIVGNFAAHPTKSVDTNEILPVEPGESQWLLDILEGLFDYCFVARKKAETRRGALNQKLQAAGKALINTASVIPFPKIKAPSA
jgi:hypothetical protein